MLKVIFPSIFRFLHKLDRLGRLHSFVFLVSPSFLQAVSKCRVQNITENQIQNLQTLLINRRQDLAKSLTIEIDRWMEKLGVPVDVGVVQKTALLGTARILRMVLEM